MLRERIIRDAVYLVARSCTDKVAYRSRRQAKQAARRAKRLYGYALRVYRCVFCGNHHMASVRQKR